MKERILIYGPPKIGISYFLSQNKDAHFIDLGGGTTYSDKNKTSFETYKELIAFLRHECANRQKVTYKYLVFDHILTLENFLYKNICSTHPLSSNEKEKNTFIDNIPYGKGYALALDMLQDLLHILGIVNKMMGVGIIFAGHSTRVNISTPFIEALTQNTLLVTASKKVGQKVELTTFDILKVWCDAILFVEQKNYFNYTPMQNYEHSERCIFTERRPWFEAGNRFQWEDEIPLDWEVFNQKCTKIETPIKPKKEIKNVTT